ERGHRRVAVVVGAVGDRAVSAPQRQFAAATRQHEHERRAHVSLLAAAGCTPRAILTATPLGITCSRRHPAAGPPPAPLWRARNGRGFGLTAMPPGSAR